MSIKDVLKHLPGKHAQSSHDPHKGGGGSSGGGGKDPNQMIREIRSNPNMSDEEKANAEWNLRHHRFPPMSEAGLDKIHGLLTEQVGDRFQKVQFASDKVLRHTQVSKDGKYELSLDVGRGQDESHMTVGATMYQLNEPGAKGGKYAGVAAKGSAVFTPYTGINAIQDLIGPKDKPRFPTKADLRRFGGKGRN